MCGFMQYGIHLRGLLTRLHIFQTNRLHYAFDSLDITYDPNQPIHL